MYKKGNFVYSGGEIDNFKAIFFSGEDISTILNDLHFKGVVQLTGKKLLDNHRNYVGDLYAKKISLSKSESESKVLRKSLIVKKALLKQKKDFKEKLLTISQGKQALYAKYIAEEIQKEKDLKKKNSQKD